MAKVFKLFLSASSNSFSKLHTFGKNQSLIKLFGSAGVEASRAQCTLSAATGQSMSLMKHRNIFPDLHNIQSSKYSTEVEKEISKFLEKEIQYESKKSTDKLPSIKGFDITNEGSDVTLTKKYGSESIKVQLSVNGAVEPMPESGEAGDPPEMVCRPPFEVEISKGDGTVLALQCNFGPLEDDDSIDEDGQIKNPGTDQQLDDQFEITDVAIHNGEWKPSTYCIAASSMDAELFDLLMDLLDERGINDEFIAHLIDYCTAFENKKYISLLKSLKEFAEK